MRDRLLILLAATIVGLPFTVALNAIEPSFAVVLVSVGAFAGIFTVIGIRADERNGRI
jgi:hypothetical protein